MTSTQDGQQVIQVTEADIERAASLNKGWPYPDFTQDPAILMAFAAHRIQARKEALEELRSAIFTYAERATEAAQSGLQIAYSIANEVE